MNIKLPQRFNKTEIKNDLMRVPFTIDKTKTCFKTQ